MTTKETTKQNLAFWNAVETTAPKYTKPAKVSGQMRTAVDAQYKKKMITEQFGMYGLGWGVVANSEGFERVHYENSTCILIYRATAFYEFGGKRAELPIAASIREAYITDGGKGYLKVDDEAVKKVRTDALTKAFTDLGFCADIHMGRFDDQDYVAGAAMAAQIKEDDDREEAAKQAYEDIKLWLGAQVKSIETIKSPDGAINAINRIKEKTINRCKAAGLASKGFEHKLDELIKQREEMKNGSK